MSKNSPRQEQRKQQIIDTLGQTIERLQRLIRIVESQDRFTKDFSDKVKGFDSKSIILSSEYSQDIWRKLVDDKVKLNSTFTNEEITNIHKTILFKFFDRKDRIDNIEKSQ